MKAGLLMVGVLAAIFVSGCDNESPTPAPAPTPTPSSVPPADMTASAPPAAKGDMATSAPTPPTFPKSASVTVGPGGALMFAPQTVEIAAGGSVTWTWGGTISHSVTSDTGVFDSGIKTSGTFSHTFAAAGTYGYFCVVHGRNVMSGTVVVH